MMILGEARTVGIIIFAIISVLSSPWYHCIFAIISVLSSPEMIANMHDQGEARTGICKYAIITVLSSPWYHHICNPHSPLFSLVSSYLQSSQSSLLLGIIIFAYQGEARTVRIANIMILTEARTLLLGIIIFARRREDSLRIGIMIFAIIQSSLLLWYHHICIIQSSLLLGIIIFAILQSSLLLGIIIFAILSVLSSP